MQSHSKWLWLFWGPLTRARLCGPRSRARAGRNTLKGQSEAAGGSSVLFAVLVGALQHKQALCLCHPQPPWVHVELL